MPGTPDGNAADIQAGILAAIDRLTCRERTLTPLDRLKLNSLRTNLAAIQGHATVRAERPKAAPKPKLRLVVVS